ncbi:hypothetical protein [Leucobacter sp. USHLN153]|uniref:hypothetical protein n=1 Tax=Leucobacter sp. USHLN153 TaxID=3081268 RepID=UPI003017B30A
MPTAVASTAGSSTPEPPVSRAVRLVRVVVLLLAGFAIAFTAPLHEQLGFDVSVTAATLVAIAVAHLADWRARRAVGGGAVPLLLAIVSAGSAVVALRVDTPIAFAFTVAAWALISALLEFVGMTVHPGSRQDAVFLGAIGILLALLVILVREDQVAVLGFLGAYAVLAGVFLGISAFDPRRSASAPTQ